MRNTFAKSFYAKGQSDDRLAIVVADISPAGRIQEFAADYPERFINTGVAEAAMIGICAGMALRGLRPFAYTIATFTLFRPYEFVRDDLCYQNLPVTIVGIGGGVSYSTLGGTHNAVEDVALCCSLPNMQVISPADSIEVEAATNWCCGENANPCYLRLSRVGDEPMTKDAEEPWRFGKVRRIHGGSGTCVLTYGGSYALATQVVEGLKAKGDDAAFYTVPTIKPLDREGLAHLMKTHKRILVIEEAVPFNGLGAQLKQLAWEVKADCDLKTFSLQDAFVHVYGTHEEVMEAHGLSPAKILAAL